MTAKLFIQAIIKIIAGIVAMGLLIFLPAGTFFKNGILLMGILFVPMLVAGIVMMCKNPDLLKKRLNVKEKQHQQRMVVALSGLMFIAGFVAAGLTIRFNWYLLPSWVTYAFAAVFLAGYILYAVVLKENAYLSRTVEVQKGQTVVDTGLYGIVRHPMYSATLLMFLAMPLILGSVYAFVIFLAYPFIIAKRIKAEEALLEKELEGYSEYKKKVKYCLIPFIW